MENVPVLLSTIHRSMLRFEFQISLINSVNLSIINPLSNQLLPALNYIIIFPDSA
jgi:hypothetical protein